MHVRRLLRVPVWPHAVTEHASSVPHADQPPCTGHGPVEHAVDVSSAKPLQSAPPCAGAGLSHVRRLVRVPVVPHAVAEHASSAPHADQPPWIGVMTQSSPSRS